MEIEGGREGDRGRQREGERERAREGAMISNQEKYTDSRSY